MSEFYKNGTMVRIKSVDMHGFLGRDDHPKESDVGQIGVVIGNTWEAHAGSGYVDPRDSGYPAELDEYWYGQVSERYSRHGCFMIICYRVQMLRGDKLDLVDHELCKITVLL